MHGRAGHPGYAARASRLASCDETRMPIASRHSEDARRNSACRMRIGLCVELIALISGLFPAKTLAWLSGSGMVPANDAGDSMFRGLRIVRMAPCAARRTSRNETATSMPRSFTASPVRSSPGDSDSNARPCTRAPGLGAMTNGGARYAEVEQLRPRGWRQHLPPPDRGGNRWSGLLRFERHPGDLWDSGLPEATEFPRWPMPCGLNAEKNLLCSHSLLRRMARTVWRGTRRA